jgi:hypothetical protein
MALDFLTIASESPGCEARRKFLSGTMLESGAKAGEPRRRRSEGEAESEENN